MRSSSTERPLAGDPDTGFIHYDNDSRSRTGGETLQTLNMQTENSATAGKQRRDKMTNKSQEEEEERGNKNRRNLCLF